MDAFTFTDERQRIAAGMMLTKEAPKHPSRIEHHLMTVTLGPLDLHAYLMSRRRGDVSAAVNRLMHEAEKFAAAHGLRLLPVVLASGPLRPATVQTIRDFLCRMDAECCRTLRAAKDFHISIWSLPQGDPFNTTLLRIH